MLARQAKKDLDALDVGVAERVRERVRQLCEDPFDPRLSIPLKNGQGLRRSRVGDWRIVYLVEGPYVIVNRIQHRRDVYRLL